MKSSLNPCHKASFHPSIPQLHIPAPTEAQRLLPPPNSRGGIPRFPTSFGKQRDAETVTKSLRKQELGL